MFSTLVKEKLKHWGLSTALAATTALLPSLLGVSARFIGVVGTILFLGRIPQLRISKEDTLAGKRSLLKAKKHFPDSPIRELNLDNPQEYKIHKIVEKLAKRTGIMMPGIYIQDIFTDAIREPSLWRRKFMESFPGQLPDKLLGIADDETFWEVVAQFLTRGPLVSFHSIVDGGGIMIASTFLSQLSVEDWSALLAHEVWHLANYDPYKELLVNLLRNIVVTSAIKQSTLMSLVLWVTAHVLRQLWKQSAEFRADFFAAQQMNQGATAMQAVLIKLEEQEALCESYATVEQEKSPLGKAVGFFSDWIPSAHPSSERRLALLDRFAEEKAAQASATSSPRLPRQSVRPNPGSPAASPSRKPSSPRSPARSDGAYSSAVSPRRLRSDNLGPVIESPRRRVRGGHSGTGSPRRLRGHMRP